MAEKAPHEVRDEAPDAAQETPSVRAGYAKSAETRARILTAALEEASDSGFHKTTLARIAVRAGVAVGNLNYHFGSRRELIGSLVVDLTARLQLAEADIAMAGMGMPNYKH